MSHKVYIAKLSSSYHSLMDTYKLSSTHTHTHTQAAHWSDADAMCEAIICLNLCKTLLHCPRSQILTVDFLINIGHLYQQKHNLS